MWGEHYISCDYELWGWNIQSVRARESSGSGVSNRSFRWWTGFATDSLSINHWFRFSISSSSIFILTQTSYLGLHFFWWFVLKILIIFWRFFLHLYINFVLSMVVCEGRGTGGREGRTRKMLSWICVNSNLWIFKERKKDDLLHICIRG